MYDVTWCGGVTEAKKIADMADAYMIPTSPHTCGGPLLYTCATHLSTAVPNFLIMESNYWKFTHQFPRTATPDQSFYLDQALVARRSQCDREGRALARADLDAAIMEGAVERVRPKMMTVTAIVAGLLPILWNLGTGSEVMRRIAAPMVGGMITAPLISMFVVPAGYRLMRAKHLAATR